MRPPRRMPGLASASQGDWREAYDVAYGKALRHVLSAAIPPPVAEEARAALAGLPAAARD